MTREFESSINYNETHIKRLKKNRCWVENKNEIKNIKNGKENRVDFVDIEKLSLRFLFFFFFFFEHNNSKSTNMR